MLYELFKATAKKVLRKKFREKIRLRDVFGNCNYKMISYMWVIGRVFPNSHNLFELEKLLCRWVNTILLIWWSVSSHTFCQLHQQEEEMIDSVHIHILLIYEWWVELWLVRETLHFTINSLELYSMEIAYSYSKIAQQSNSR